VLSCAVEEGKDVQARLDDVEDELPPVAAAPVEIFILVLFLTPNYIKRRS